MILASSQPFTISDLPNAGLSKFAPWHEAHAAIEAADNDAAVAAAKIAVNTIFFFFFPWILEKIF